ncbi:hypothetical protein IWX91DRAFT_327538 [Phyllosticta citricarpa]
MALSVRSVPACLASPPLRLHLVFLFWFVLFSFFFPQPLRSVPAFQEKSRLLPLSPSAFSLLSAQPAVRVRARLCQAAPAAARRRGEWDGRRMEGGRTDGAG